jgi:calcium-dependent protein kinase
MGVFCQSCNSFLNKSEHEPLEITEGSNKEILLPKQYVGENITNDEESKTETLKNIHERIKDERKELNKLTKTKTSYQRDNEKEEIFEVPKTKTEKKENILQKCISSKMVIQRKLKRPEKKDNFGERRIKKLNSFTSSKKIDVYGLGLSLIIKNNDNPEKIENKTEKNNININKVPTKKQYKRRQRKSTTLMENSNILKHLFLVQMKVPVSQELLVLQQKGNPSDKYIRGKKIGSGSFGTVYEAKNLIFNTKVAMKVIVKKQNMNKLLIENEIDILKKLSHPNIVRIYEFYESLNNFYLINEYCDEGELYNYINKSTLNEQQLAVIFYQVFSGLSYLHENNILHRDLKPENILISKKEVDLSSEEVYFWIQIIDFGTAKIFEENKTEKSIVGSAYYIAPEVLKKDYNEKCDTWSVGVILFMFLTGRPPFDGRNNEEIIKSIKTKKLDEQNPKLLQRSPEVRDLVIGLLEKDMNKRLSAKEALNHPWFKKFNGRKLFENFKEEDIQLYIDNLLNYTFHSKIQQLVIAFLVHNLPTTDSKRNILKLYRYFNLSGDCKLTKEELINGLKKYKNKEEIDEKVDNLFLLLDSDNNGQIEYEEFLRACIDKKEILTEEYLKYAFKFLDKENKGKLSVQEINNAFLGKGNEDKLFEIALTKDISEVDGDGDGIINFKEFKQLMLNTLK